jgi:hypothetical protein
MKYTQDRLKIWSKLIHTYDVTNNPFYLNSSTFLKPEGQLVTKYKTGGGGVEVQAIRLNIRISFCANIV